MEYNYQEKILDRYHGFEAVRDCFAITRIQNEIVNLSDISAFDRNVYKERKDRIAELDAILIKYSDVIEIRGL